MNKIVPIVLLSGIATFFSCVKKDATDNPTDPTSVATLAPEGFTFSTSRNVNINVKLLTNDDKPIKGVLVNVYSSNNADQPIFTTLSNEDGSVTGSLNIPAYVDTLIIDPSYIGLMRNAVAPVKNAVVSGVIGGSKTYGGDIIPNQTSTGNASGRLATIASNESIAGITYSIQGSLDKDGKPTTLAGTDPVSSELLSFINTSLPETKSVPVYHADYLSSNAETNLNIEKLADVWITFIHEGAGYKNSLGYYTYPTNNPPQSAADITDIKILIGNASLTGSGGTINSGDKILVGRFAPGTSVGFVLFQNAWNGTSVNYGAKKYYSDDALNPEGASTKRHTVLLYDDKYKLFLHGIEDQQRDAGGSDNDFNDLVFYATSNPVDAISTMDVNPTDKPVDTDGDGATDTYDKFPTDPTRAYIQYFPTQDTWGTLAFEDLWPLTGDYDLNDLVVGYNYQFINNAKNNTVEINGKYAIRGIGASYKNGLGIQLPFSSTKVSSITGQKFLSNYVSTNSNGTEAGQSKAVFFPFDDTRALIGEGTYVNNINGKSVIQSDTAKIKILFAAPITPSELGTAPFNPFLVANQLRGHEVHLPGKLPTEKTDTKLFGTGSDKTNPITGKYYLTENNWPWALQFVEDFEYPTEKNNISNVFTYFLPWAKSGGSTNTDWYKSKNGYRNEPLIYKRK